MKTLIAAVCVTFVSTLVPASLVAQDAPAAAAAEPAADDSIRGTVGVDVTTGYYFRGIRFEDQGLIVQPRYELACELLQAGDQTPSVEMLFGTWNSFHGGPTGTDGGNSSWYEADGYVGLTVGLGERWSLAGTYTWYSSPNGAFEVAEEAIVGISFDDAGLFGESFGGLQPALSFGFETKGQQDGGANRGIYAQIGIAPEFALGSFAGGELGLSLPFAVGFSLSDYYEGSDGSDHAFGFADLGIVLSEPLAFVPSRFGPWTATVSLHALFLGEMPEEANGGDDFQLIGACGISTTF